jgi:hypothetical protein
VLDTFKQHAGPWKDPVMTTSGLGWGHVDFDPHHFPDPPDIGKPLKAFESVQCDLQSLDRMRRGDLERATGVWLSLPPGRELIRRLPVL